MEDERGKTAQLKRDMENFKKKAKAEQEKVARMVRTCLTALCTSWSKVMPKHNYDQKLLIKLPAH